MWRGLIRDDWDQHLKESLQAQVALEKKAAELKQRKKKLTKAFVFDGSIDKETFEELNDDLSVEETMIQAAVAEAKLDHLDIDGALGYAETMLRSADRLWLAGDLEQRQRLQRLIYPSGSFGTQCSRKFEHQK